MTPTQPAQISSAIGLLKIDEAAARLGCSTKSVRRLVNAGRLACVRYTDSKREPLKFRQVDVARLIESSVSLGKGCL